MQQRYPKEISSGKLKLHSNEKNLGQYFTLINLIGDSIGKYFTILHSDDMYLPHTLSHFYNVAEKFNADVVHSCYFLASPDANINPKTINVICGENNPVNKITILPNDIFSRLMAWSRDEIFIDLQYNFFRRQFVVDNYLFQDEVSVRMNVFWLRFILKAKVLVKTPEVTYIYRNSPDSVSNDINKFPIEDFIRDKIELARNFDRYLPELKLFEGNAEIQRFIKLKLLIRSHCFQISGRRIYKDGISSELYDRVENIFRKEFGDSATYLAMLFHTIFMIPNSQNFEQIIINDGLRRVEDSLITPPPRIINEEFRFEAA